MKISRRVLVPWLAMLFLVPPLAAWGSTIAPGQVRVVQGKVAAVDVPHRAVVVDVAVPAGTLTVGVTLAPSVEPMGPKGALPLSDIQVGQPAVLRYTRENDRLVGLDLTVRH